MHSQSGLFSSLDDPPESSFEMDADAARQLVHALVMNCVGRIMSWQDTLARLVIDYCLFDTYFL